MTTKKKKNTFETYENFSSLSNLIEVLRCKSFKWKEIWYIFSHEFYGLKPSVRTNDVAVCKYDKLYFVVLMRNIRSINIIQFVTLFCYNAHYFMYRKLKIDEKFCWQVLKWHLYTTWSNYGFVQEIQPRHMQLFANLIWVIILSVLLSFTSFTTIDCITQIKVNQCISNK